MTCASGTESCSFGNARQQENENSRQDEWRQHCRKKHLCGKVVIAEKIKILRIAERCDHSAEIGGTVLQNEQERRVLFLTGGGKNKPAKWQKSQQGGIIGQKHRPRTWMTTSAVHTPRNRGKGVCTIRCERAEKICRSRRAPTTAKTLNRQGKRFEVVIA